MSRTIVAAIVCAGAFASQASAASPIQILEDFSSDPSSRWSVFGDSTRFQWDSTEGNLRVEWDSSKPKSFFYLPVDQTLTRNDSFSFAFDFELQDIASGHEEGKTGPMQIGIGLLNFGATNVSWSRTSWGSSPDVFEFNTYPEGYWPDWGAVEPTTLPSVVASNGNGYLASTTEFIMALPLNQPVRVTIRFDAASQTLTAVWTTNGVTVGQVHELVIGDDILIAPNEDFAVNMFSISNYESSPWDSVLAHGKVDNISIMMAAPAALAVAGGFADGQWRVSFLSVEGRTYTLERTEGLGFWTPVGESAPGTGQQTTLTDMNPPASRAFYRVRVD